MLATTAADVRKAAADHTGYFLEGGVYELSFSAPDLPRSSMRSGARPAERTPVDIVCGFYENREGTYHNSALYATIGGGRGAGRARAPQDVLADVRRVRRRALSLARARARRVPTPFGTRGDLHLRRRVAFDHADDRRAQGRAHDDRSERVARPRTRRRRHAGERRALARDAATLTAERTRRVRALRGAHRVRRRQRHVGCLVHRLAARRAAGSRSTS